MIGKCTVKKKLYDDVLSRFHTIPACYTDRRTDRIAISISRVSTLMTRDENTTTIRRDPASFPVSPVKNLRHTSH